MKANQAHCVPSFCSR